MRVEFFGISRERAGITEFDLQAETLGQLLNVLVVRFPSFNEVVQSGRLRSPFLANLNGDRFISDPATKLSESDCVLILSADAGG
jgi:molybdopterin converting factor small subunit